MALTLSAVCVLAARSLRTVDDSLQAVARTEYAQAQLVDIDQSLSDLLAMARAYASAPEEPLYGDYRRLVRHIDATLDRLDALVPSPGLTRYGVDALAALARDREQFAAQVIAQARAGEDGAAQRLLRLGQAKGNRAAMRATIAVLQTEGHRVLSLDRQAIGRARVVFLVALWVSGVAAVLLLAGVARQLLRRAGRLPAGGFGAPGTLPVD